MILNEFKNSKEIITKLKAKIDQLSRDITIMEVCGTHTMAIFRQGIRDLLPEGVKLISGPGCPVCVTQNEIVDKAIVLSQRDDVIITTFGDMLKVPGTNTSLMKTKAEGAQVEIVYSPLDSIEIAKKNPDKKIVFIAVGFETTIPTIALAIKEAKANNLNNFFILCAHKTVPKALEALISMDKVNVDAFLLPGHVSSIIGTDAYNFIAGDHGVPGVVAGFEPVDVLYAIYLMLDMISKGESKILNAYGRVVTAQGNKKAQAIIDEVFQECDSYWRGVGNIPGSGLKLREEFASYDIENEIDIDVSFSKEASGCLCGEILCGVKTPPDCKLFGKVCNPEHPVGPCMVSFEGTCSAYYKYARA